MVYATIRRSGTRKSSSIQTSAFGTRSGFFRILEPYPVMMFQRLITSCSWALPLINLSLCTESEIANLGPKRAWQQAVGSTSKPTKKPSLDLYHDCPISLEFMNPGPSLLSSGQESQFVNHHDRIDRPNLGSDASWKGILHDCDVVSAPSNSWQPSEPGSSIDPMNSYLNGPKFVNLDIIK